MQDYLLGDEVVKSGDPNNTRVNEVMEGRKKRIFDAVVDYRAGKDVNLAKFFGGVHGEFIVDAPAYITDRGPEPVRVGEIPTFYKGPIEQQEAVEKLIVDAAVEHSYEKALMAFTLSKIVPSLLVAKKILDDMIVAIRLTGRSCTDKYLVSDRYRTTDAINRRKPPRHSFQEGCRGGFSVIFTSKKNRRSPLW